MNCPRRLTPREGIRVNTRVIVPVALAMAAAAAVPARTGEEEQKGSWLPGEITGGVALTSDYVSRGIPNSNGEPALQGNLEYAVETGVLGTSVYAGFWGSNVDFQDGDEATVEIDALFGLRGQIGETGGGWGLGGIYYWYPGASRSLNYDYWEIAGVLSYDVNDWLSVEATDLYSPEYFGKTGQANYSTGTVSVKPPVPWFDLSLNASVGYQWVEHAPDGLDWSFGPTVTIKGVSFTAAYIDSNYKGQKDCGSNHLCDARAVFTVAASF